MSAAFYTWTIYDHPADYPYAWVVRRFRVTADSIVPTGPPALANSIEQARGILPPGLFRMPRQDGDEPQIVETWL